jgi:hypothetical protein
MFRKALIEATESDEHNKSSAFQILNMCIDCMGIVVKHSHAFDMWCIKMMYLTGVVLARGS